MATTRTAKKKTAKKSPPPKAAKKTAKKSASKTSNAKKKATAKKGTAKKKAAPKASDKLEEDKLSEEDVEAKVAEINELVAETEQNRTANDWKIGQALCWIRERVTDGTWTRVCTEKIQGLAGRVLGKSSIDKKMKLFRTFENDEDRAVAIGVGRLDQICRLPTTKEREAVLEGVKIKGELVQVEDMKVRDLAAYIDVYMEKAHPKKVKTPQEQFVSGVCGVAKKAGKLLEDHSKTLKSRKFEVEEIENLKAAIKDIKEFLGALTIQPSAAAKKALNKKAA